MEKHTFTISNVTSEAVAVGWKFTKKYFWTIMLLWAITYLPSLISSVSDIAVNYIPGATHEVLNPDTNQMIVELLPPRDSIIAILSSICGIIWARLWLWLIKTSFMILKDEKPIVKDLSVPWMYLLRLIGWSILVGIAIILWVIALIIPGIYIAIRLSMFKYFIVEWYGVIDAIKASRHITEWNTWKMLVMYCYMSVVYLLWLLLLWVGLLWAIPTVMLAEAHVYLQLKKNLLIHSKE
jgi:hypothetical protein